MLDGDALTAVEHLEFAEFAVDGGDEMIFNILEARYLDKDPIDRAGKALFDVFEVSAREGERLSEWSARAQSVLLACHRDAGIALTCVYIAAGCRMISGQWCWVTGGKYEFASTAPALRSCFPGYPVPKLIEDLTECLCRKCRRRRKRRRSLMKKLTVTVWTM